MRVLVECYHDTALVRSLGMPSRRVGHEHGKGNVLRQLAKWDGDAVGIVDADPDKQNSNPAEMAKYREMDNAYGMKLMVHQGDRRKALIVISPMLEDWLLARARACKISPRDFGLPDEPRMMHKNPRHDRKPAFYRFLGELLKSDDGMKTLKKWLAV